MLRLFLGWAGAVWRQVAPLQSLAERGERAAAGFLKKKGMWLVARRQRDQFGEIDLIAVDRSVGHRPVLVFVEVKTRQSHQKGHPAEAVDLDKQRRITQAALRFLRRRRLLGYAARFDVVAVTWPDAGSRPQIEHFPGAFLAVGHQSMYS